MHPETWLDKAPLRFRSLFRRGELDQELEDELQYHIARATERNIEVGMPAAEARRAALRSMTGLEQIKEECRDARGIRVVDELCQDIRHSLRSLCKTPGFSSIAVATFGLAVAAITAVLCLIYAVLVRPLPYPAEHELVLLWQEFPAQRLSGVPFSAPEFSDLEVQTRTFGSLSAFGYTEFRLTGHGPPESVQAAEVSANLFSLLQVKPIKGRVFGPTEGADEAAVVVISERLWRRSLHSDATIVGRQLSLNGKLHRVLGIMPAGFEFPLPLFNIRGQFAGSADIWKPVASSKGQNAARHRRTYGVVGRVAQGVPFQGVQADLDQVAQEWRQRYAGNYKEGAFELHAYPLHGHIIGSIRTPLLILLGSVLLVVCIAGVNLTAMLLARNGTRAREMAVRAALGAGPLRLLRQLLTEAVFLALCGAGLGVILGGSGLIFLRRFGAETIPRIAHVTLHLYIMVIILVMSLVAGILIGLASARINWNSTDANMLKAENRGVIRRTRRGRLQSSLLVLEIALAIVVSIAAGSLMKGFVRLESVNAGFNRVGVLTMEISVPYSDDHSVAEFFSEATRRIATIPSVTSAGFTSVLPLSGSNRDASFTVEGDRERRRNSPPDEEIRIITPNYFEVLQTPLLQGRFFTPLDTADSPPVVIINQALAQCYWPRGDALGKRMALNASPKLQDSMVVVGIVGNMRHRELTEKPRPEFYVPHAQQPFPSMVLVVRSAQNVRTLVPAIHQQIISIDPSQPLAKIRTLDRVVANSIAPRRITIVFFAAFGCIAIAFAAVGIYGVISCLVAERRQEIAIRIALGARRWDIVRLVAPFSLRFLFIGAVLGLAGAFGANRLLMPLLYNVAAFDPGLFLTVLGVAGVAGLFAVYIPVKHAARVDLVEALGQG